MRAAEHVAALHLPRQWKARREIDQPRHEVDVEERGREAAFGRRHPVSRVEVSPLELHTLRRDVHVRQHRGGLDHDVWAVPAHGRDRAGVTDRLGPKFAVVRGSVRMLPARIHLLHVQEIEHGDGNAVDRPSHDVLAGLLDAA